MFANHPLSKPLIGQSRISLSVIGSYRKLSIPRKTFSKSYKQLWAILHPQNKQLNTDLQIFLQSPTYIHILKNPGGVAMSIKTSVNSMLYKNLIVRYFCSLIVSLIVYITININTQ